MFRCLKEMHVSVCWISQCGVSRRLFPCAAVISCSSSSRV